MIRPATLADVEAIADLETDALGADAWSGGLVREGVVGNLPTIHYLVAAQDGRLDGYAVASVVADVAELQRIAVRPDVRRSGLASALLEEVVALGREGRADRVLLEVRETNTVALAFYAARGFVEVHRRPRYFHDGETAVVMRRPLGPGCGGGS